MAALISMQRIFFILAKHLTKGNTAPDFEFDTPWESGQTLYETIGHKTAVLVFLRYHGCPICQMEMAHLKRAIGLFRHQNAEVFAFLQSEPSTMRSLAQEEDWPFNIVCDPNGLIFKLYGDVPAPQVLASHLTPN
ncbi:MAG: redoxin domain-containing protein [Desulfobacterales bacterium]|nr:redoxin domain-containing protein [Desulfobacterales bacterium]